MAGRLPATSCLLVLPTLLMSGAAKEAYERVRRKSFVVDGGSQGIMLDFSDFGSLVQFLHDRCGWERFEPQLRIKHFEGWDEIEWKD